MERIATTISMLVSLRKKGKAKAKKQGLTFSGYISELIKRDIAKK